MKNMSSIVRHYNISFGINYSNFKNTTANGKTGMYGGIYKKTKINRLYILQYGLSYMNKKAFFLDKHLKSDGFDDGITLFISDIKSNYHFIEINCMIKRKILNNEFFLVYPLIGAGYSINIRDDTKIIHKSVIISDKPVQIFDYRYANESVGPLFANTGFILHLGFEIEVENYSGSVVYSYNTHNIRRTAGFLPIEEKLNSITVIFGVNI
ncbi:MAG: hypothetical protein H8E08_00585 [Candidatus Marinimicrobia bacterium]|nr:hypothetical protein [Candidatus Neomarinimicrobiota bacterium]